MEDEDKISAHSRRRRGKNVTPEERGGDTRSRLRREISSKDIVSN